MKIALTGYEGVGKSSLFQWLTGQPAEPMGSPRSVTAMAAIPEPRLERLQEIYGARKVTCATLELVDTPGLRPGQEGNAARLAQVRESKALVLVAAAFGDFQPARQIQSLQEDLVLADLEIIENRIQRLKEALRKPRPQREQQQEELGLLERIARELESSGGLATLQLNPEEEKTVRSYQLFSLKPRMVLVNTEEDVGAQWDPQWLPHGCQLPALAVSLALELELEAMEEGERQAFCREMGVRPAEKQRLFQMLLDVAGVMTFFTCGPKEVRTWLVPRGSTAVEAAGAIHSDLARGFIRAEVMNVDQLIEAGGERQLKALHGVRQEPRTYVVQPGDVLLIRHNA